MEKKVSYMMFLGERKIPLFSSFDRSICFRFQNDWHSLNALHLTRLLTLRTEFFVSLTFFFTSPIYTYFFFFFFPCSLTSFYNWIILILTKKKFSRQLVTYYFLNDRIRTFNFWILSEFLFNFCYWNRKLFIGFKHLPCCNPESVSLFHSTSISFSPYFM